MWGGVGARQTGAVVRAAVHVREAHPVVPHLRVLVVQELLLLGALHVLASAHGRVVHSPVLDTDLVVLVVGKHLGLHRGLVHDRGRRGLVIGLPPPLRREVPRVLLPGPLRVCALCHLCRCPLHHPRRRTAHAQPVAHSQTRNQKKREERKREERKRKPLSD